MDVNISSTSQVSFPCPLSLAFSLSHPLNRAGSPNCWAVACSKRRRRVFCAATTNSNENSPVTDSSSGRSQAQARQPSELDPATQFSSLANAFSRRLALGIVGASIVAIGGNLGGITSLLLGFEPQISRDLKLDAVYPVRGYKRCVDTSNGFEFVYPSSWVGDQTLLYRAVERAEKERSLGLPPLQDRVRQQQTAREPIVAFGPPGSNGELNVSVIVAPVPTNFLIEKLGEPKQAGEAILSNFIVSRNQNIAAILLDAKKREAYLNNQKITYYNLEYTVQGPSFLRHNLAVYTACAGRLFTLNAQCPEVLWPTLKDNFYEVSDSFKLVL